MKNVIIYYVFCFSFLAVRSAVVYPESFDVMSFDAVCRMASDLSHNAFIDESSVLPESLQKLNYDQYKAINYRRSNAIWNGQKIPFRIEFFHRGYLYKDRIDVNIIEDGKMAAVKFSPDLFEYHRGMPADLNENIGFAGFRVLYSSGTPAEFSEIVSFLGASYFRAAPPGAVYGASARGIAIDTFTQGKKEEFPSFRKFWIFKPDANVLTIYALLDGPSITGSYRFEIETGNETSLFIHENLFARKPIEALGLAPLSSMYMYGEDRRPGLKQMDDHPEVHDSDSLLIDISPNEWILRPLQNSSQTLFSSFDIKGNPKGFGFLQRDRNAVNYNDSGATPEKRPSIWVKPQGQWPAGRVDLLEISTSNDWEDNIAAQYLLNQNLKPSDELIVEYRLSFYLNEKPLHQLARVIRTIRKQKPDGNLLCEIDFKGKGLTASDKPAVTASGGKVANIHMSKMDSDVYRLSFDVSADDKSKIIELRASLFSNKKCISEIWSDQWKP